MPSPHKKSVGTIGGILLVEEYQPLAMAFGAAIRKFAGDHETRVVVSLLEAERDVDRFAPELIVLDFDPPPRGSVAFFNQLKSSLPKARIIILVPGKAPGFRDVRAAPPTFNFVEKPFELATFGAVLEQLIGSKSETEYAGGTARDFNLIDIIMLHAMSGAATALRVEAGGARSGEIHFFEGRISHAVVAGRSGVEAFQKILGWRSPRFTEMERPTDAPRTIHASWKVVLSDALRASPAASVAQLPEPVSAPPPAPTPSGKKIVIVDDTELLSLFVEEILRTADPTFEIRTALTGLEGLRRISEAIPDLVLLDYSLPDVTGAEVARRLLQSSETAALPIIIMSGHVAEMTATAERFENVVATIAKPFRSEELVELVAKTFSELPKIAERRRKKGANKRPTLEVVEPHVVAAKKARNGKRIKIVAPVPVEVTEAPDLGPEPIDVEPPAIVEVIEASAARPEPVEVVEPPVVEPEPSEIEDIEIDPITFEEEIADPPQPSSAEIVQALGIPAMVRDATSNAVVFGLPLEVIAIEFSPALRIEKIRARPFAACVSIRVLPQANPGTPIFDALFELARVDLDAEERINSVRLVPPSAPLSKTLRYPTAIDGVAISPTVDGRTVELTPTAVAPMRFQLLALFELASVELSPDFSLAHLDLKSRGGKTRITLLPEVAQTGATFRIEKVRLSGSGGIEEISLYAVEV